MRCFLARLDEKRKLLGNFEKFLKVFDENSIEKLIFIFYFLENLLLKIEPSEITPFFYNNFFAFGGISPLFPLAMPLKPENYQNPRCKSGNIRRNNLIL